jgi:oligoribonuclease (3'-5' exoribonuclease)
LKKFNLLWSLVFALPVLQAMQQGHSHSRPNFMFLDVTAQDMQDKNWTMIDVGALVADADLNVHKELHEGILFYNPDLDEYIASDPSSVITFQENPEFIVKARELNPALQDLENNILKALSPSPLLVEGENMKKGEVCDFIRKFMPVANQLMFKTKICDVASIRTAVKLWNPSCPFERQTAHTSFENVHSLLEELKYYRTRYFSHPFAEIDEEAELFYFEQH